MSSLLATCILFAFSSLAAVMTRKRFEEHLPLAVCTVTGGLYGFALLGGLQTGFYAVLVLAVLCAAALPIWLIIKREQQLWKYIATPGCMVYLLIAVWLLISYRGYMYTGWDDFSHWGLAVKNMFIFSQLPSGNAEATISYVDYPPATALFSWFWARLSGAFNEGDTQRALNMMMLCYLLPVLKNQKWKQTGKTFAVASILFVLPLVVYRSAYRSLQVDCLLGCQAMYILYTWFEEKHDAPVMMNICASLFLMPLVKESGMLIAAMVIAVLVADGFICGKQNSQKLLPLALMLPVVLGRASWNGYLQANQVAQVWDKSVFSIRELVSLLTGHGPAYHGRVITKYVKYLCSAEWWHSGDLFNLSHVMWILIAAGLQCWCVKRTGNSVQKKRYQRGFSLLLLEMVIYIVVLLVMYLVLFRPDEAENLVSMDRYLASFMLPVIGWTALTAVRTSEGLSEQSDSCMAFAVMLGLFLVVNPSMIAQDTVIAYEQNTAAYEFRMDELLPEKVVSEVNSTTDRVYIVACGDSGFQYYLGAYQFTPVPVQSGLWTAWPVCSREPEWYEKWAIEYSPQEWAQTLLEGGFTHVYLDTIDERFIKDYVPLFETPSSIRSAVLYRVEANDESVKLVSLQ